MFAACSSDIEDKVNEYQMLQRDAPTREEVRDAYDPPATHGATHSALPQAKGEVNRMIISHCTRREGDTTGRESAAGGAEVKTDRLRAVFHSLPKIRLITQTCAIFRSEVDSSQF